MEKLKSRKLWVAVAAALVAFIGQYNVEMAESVNSIANIAIAYLVAQGVVDTAEQVRK